MRRVRLVRVLAPVAATVLATGLLAGCASAAPAIGASSSIAPSATAGAGSGATTSAPSINLDGTAAQNQAYFDLVNEKFIAAGGDLTGRPFIDNLVKAGFPKAKMEVTPDRTSVNLAADNIQFSIRFGTTCLIGQYGNIGYASTHTTVLGNGRCLVGTTRPIDW